MRKHRGKFSTIFTAVIAIALLLATAVLFVEAYKERNIMKAEQFIKDGNTYEALQHYKKAESVSIHPNEKILKGIIDCSITEGDLATAEKTTEKLLKIEPENAKMRFILGKIQIKNNDFDSAKEQIRKLREMRTEETQKYADDLTSQIRATTVKDFLEGIIDKVAPIFDITGKEKEQETTSTDITASKDVAE